MRISSNPIKVIGYIENYDGRYINEFEDAIKLTIIIEVIEKFYVTL